MEQFETSESIVNVVKKVFEVQKKELKITKNSFNPFYKSYFADLASHIDVLKPALNEVGLVVMQMQAGQFLITMISDPDTGEYIRGGYPVNLKDKTPQEVGSGISFAKRYSVASTFLLASEDEDDDGNTASGKKDSDVKPTPDKEWLNLPANNPADKVKSEKLKAGIASGKYKTMSDIRKDWNVSVVVKDLIIKQYPNITPN